MESGGIHTSGQAESNERLGTEHELQAVSFISVCDSGPRWALARNRGGCYALLETTRTFHLQ